MELGIKVPLRDEDVGEDGRQQLLQSLDEGAVGDRGATEDKQIRRRSATYPFDSREKKYSRQYSFSKSWKAPWHHYAIVGLLFYALCVLVVITIFNAVFLSKLKYLACTIAKTWNFAFPMC